MGKWKPRATAVRVLKASSMLTIRQGKRRAEHKLDVGHSNQSVTICHACESKCAYLLAFDATAKLPLFSPFHLHWLPLVTQTQSTHAGKSSSNVERRLFVATLNLVPMLTRRFVSTRKKWLTRHRVAPSCWVRCSFRGPGFSKVTMTSSLFKDLWMQTQSYFFTLLTYFCVLLFLICCVRLLFVNLVLAGTPLSPHRALLSQLTSSLPLLISGILYCWVMSSPQRCASKTLLVHI